MKAGSLFAIRWLMMAGMALMMAACAVTPPDQAPLAQGSLERSGRFAVNVEDTLDRRESVQGNFLWRDTRDGLTLQLMNPFGSILAEVRVVPGQAMLTRSDGSREYAEHADELIAQVLHSPVPVAGLRDWLRGRVDRERATSVTSTGQDAVSSFIQDGWRVSLSRYDNQGPTLLQLNRQDGSRNIRIRLAIDAG
jgi:outer membrane lipoprotein LolB